MHQSKISTWKAIRFLLSYVKKYRAAIFTGIALLMIVDTFQLMIPRIIKKDLRRFRRTGFFARAYIKKCIVYRGARRRNGSNTVFMAPVHFSAFAKNRTPHARGHVYPSYRTVIFVF